MKIRSKYRFTNILLSLPVKEVYNLLSGFYVVILKISKNDLSDGTCPHCSNVNRCGRSANYTSDKPLPPIHPIGRQNVASGPASSPSPVCSNVVFSIESVAIKTFLMLVFA